MTNPVEQTATQIWTQILKPAPGEEGLTFFALSGQSVSAMRIVASLESELGIELDISVLFDDPDLDTYVRTVAALVAAGGASAAA
ncbi:phosphopantetheine-binding protein [Streptomyces antarcticus]|uniref:phosphopantetheine-binding protein n=1 Tax=Streptomyces antarcticus TaxID=2996458 RepID=UPI00226D6543|nr:MULTISPECIES: phosphopantetheine-binding protein [unclassified Streptomyces]MCY0942935.1 phosphopantetheine-binding protein [Streptomyces sp. H34-AA3]MCY0953018.1 phosphopantetheine-binding protein [Streptomyces sp. H27-S2]MCZ4083105.1 phosphopantetheine-binding protein [Streptomyces sp. H34-S5]